MTKTTKMKKDDKDVEKNRTYVIWKGDENVMGNGVKKRAVETVLCLLQRTMGIDVLDGERSWLAVIPSDRRGDHEWMLAHGAGEGAVVGSTGRKDSEDRAAAIAERLGSDEGYEGQAGWTLLEYYLRKYYMQYDMWEV